MKKIYKRVLALLLVCVIVSSTTYKAHAAAAVPVVVSAGEAIAYVLGILGITAGAGYVIDKKEEITSWGSDQIVKLKEWTKTNSDKVNAWGAATSQEIESSIDAWFEKLRTGTLDTASAVWDSIKAWGGSIYDAIHNPVNAKFEKFQLLQSGVKYLGTYATRFGPIYYTVSSTYPVYGVQITVPNDTYTNNRVLIASDYPFQYSYNTSDTSPLSFQDARLDKIAGLYIISSTLGYPCEKTDLKQIVVPKDKTNSDYSYYKYLFGVATDVPSSDYTTVGGVSDIYDRDKSLDNIGVVVPGIAAGATDIPIDWGLVGDIAGTLTDVRAGVKDIADTLADAKVFPIDTTRDTVIDSDGDLSNDKAKDDVIPAVPNVGTLDDYKLAGLEKVFPFCIPFDLIAFLGCLSAAPEAPAFDWVFPLPGKDADVYTLHVDLSPWDPVAKIVRTMETLAFCVGLTMITREKMIMS